MAKSELLFDLIPSLAFTERDSIIILIGIAVITLIDLAIDRRALIYWLGPIVQEYYAGSEGNDLTFISTQEWLQKPGSVGKAVFGTVHICDSETGEDLSPGETGTVYFAGESNFEYHGDAGKMQRAYHARHTNRSTMGDVGHVDEDGYLFLTDRKANMIISGGVNIYPQETENVLLEHPSVLDAAVLGVLYEDMGERVKAFVQLMLDAKSDWTNYQIKTIG